MDDTMKKLHLTLITTLGALALAASAAVTAAPQDGPDHGGPGMHQGREGQRGDMAAMASQRLAKLKDELKITAQQEPAWQAFATRATDQAKAMQAQHEQARQERDKADAAKLSAPERMAQQLTQMKQHLAAMETLQASVKDLYAVLTPEQRSQADRHFAHLQHMRMERHHWHG
jgi:Spy/CpxP family protein refolding chaperone